MLIATKLFCAPERPPALVRYGEVPLGVTPDDPARLFDLVVKAIEKDSFEKTEAYQVRVSNSDLTKRDFRIVTGLADIQPFPDQDLYVVKMGGVIGTDLVSKKAIVEAATITDSDEAATIQNGFGAKREITSISGRKIILVIMNDSKLGSGLVWKDDPKDAAVHFGLRFHQPSQGLLELMKMRRLALMLRFTITDLAKVRRADEVLPARMDSGYQFVYRDLFIPVELKAISVISSDQKTGYAVWASDFIPPATPSAR